jgi:ribosomal protein S18 acetylase RimI-like enzyme
MKSSPVSSITCRPAGPEDLDFLLALRITTMGPHHRKAGIPQTPEQQRARVLDQYDCAQVIEQRGVPIGLWKVVRSPDEWKVLQVQLLPSRQGRGIASDLLRTLLAEANAASVPVTLNVLKVNPARRLYERLGFQVVGENEHAYRMRNEGSPALEQTLQRRCR